MGQRTYFVRKATICAIWELPRVLSTSILGTHGRKIRCHQPTKLSLNGLRRSPPDCVANAIHSYSSGQCRLERRTSVFHLPVELSGQSLRHQSAKTVPRCRGPVPLLQRCHRCGNLLWDFRWFQRVYRAVPTLLKPTPARHQPCRVVHVLPPQTNPSGLAVLWALNKVCGSTQTKNLSKRDQICEPN